MGDEKTVLIIDDEPDAVAIVETVVSLIDGAVAVSANDGKGGLAKARAEKPDVVVLDVQMPGMSGFEVFQEIRKDEDSREVPVIMLTGVAEKADIGFSSEEMGEYMGAEPAAYFEKPVDPVVLQSKISDLLGD